MSAEHGNFQTALSLAAILVAQRRAQAPIGFDPQAVASDAVAETDDKTASAGAGTALSPELFNKVRERMGAEGKWLKPAVVEKPSEQLEGKEVSRETRETATETVALPETETETEEATTLPVEFAPEQDAEVAKRIEAAQTELQTRLAATEAKLLEAEQKTATPGQTVLSANVHPLLQTADAREIQKYHNEFLETERWAARHSEGYGPESEGWKEGHTQLTGAQVREMFTTYKQEHDALLPAAQQRLAMISHAEPIIKQKYPTLFDKKSEDYQQAQNILNSFPEMRRDPTALMAIGDMLAGRKARIAKEKAEATATAAQTAIVPKGAKPAGGGAPKPGAGQSALRSRETAPANRFQDKSLLKKVAEQRGSVESVRNMLFPKRVGNN